MAGRRKGRFVLGLAFLGAIALISSHGNQAVSARTRTMGADRMVSLHALPDTDGEVCPILDSTFLSAVTALPQQGQSRAVGAPGPVWSRAGNIDKKPLRYIKDPNPAWSSIAVNAENDMVVMTDENLFRLVEYSRSTNTPPTGPVAEPRRVIGGDKTHMEMQCGVYVDPKTLEVYITNNDTQDWMPVFSREARGNVAPDRFLATPHRTWGITADETRQELYMTIEHPAAVIVYRKSAVNNEAPLRFLEGDATALADPHGIALDMKHDYLIIANHGHRRFYGGPAVSTLARPWEEWIAPTDDLNGLPRRYLPGLGAFELPSINIYARDASGNTAPLRVIQGPKTQLNWPSHVQVHEERGEIFVANDADDSVLVFRESDRGDVAPIRVIKGPRTRVQNPTGLSLDVKNGELWVASMGNFTATVFPVIATGDVAPLRQIRGGPPDQMALMIGNPGAVAYDSKRQEILVPN
jgi:6-phosphogluconolactonase (cycloisomerase 2 family)